MNKLLTYEGGQPFTTGDLEFIQKCYDDSIRALSLGLSDQKDCILYGITGTAGNISPGAVVIGGEVITVDNTMQHNGEQYLCFRKKTQEDRVFADSLSHEVQEVMEPYLSNEIGGSYKYIDLNAACHLVDVITGDAFWEKADISLGAGTTVAEVETNKRTGIIRINKLSWTKNSDYHLFSIQNGENLKINGIGVTDTTNNIISMVSLAGAIFALNPDGTSYDKGFTIRNVILK